MMLALCEPQNTIFNDDNCAVDDQPEIQRAQTHQVGTDFRLYHARDQHKHGQGNDHRRKQCSANITKHYQQHNHHQDGAFEQVGLHRGNGFVHQHCAVVNRFGGNPLRQGFVDLRQLLSHRL